MSNLFKILSFAVLLSSFASCVSNKDLVYLQDEKTGPKNLEEGVFKATPKDYALETHDVVSVKINHLELSKEFQQVSADYDTQARLGVQHPMLTGFNIDEEGFVELPTMGKIKIGGMTILEAQREISESAKSYYSNAAVKVFLLNSYVTVLGEVNRPGRFPVYVNEISILEAIGMAGDATDYAEREQIRVIRNRGDKNEVILVNLNDENLLASQAYYLQPNDIILVNPLGKKKFIRRDPQNLYNAIGAVVSLVTLYLLVK